MFERYTKTARHVVPWSVYIARRIGSPEIEPEHLLLALLRTDKRLARRFLGSPWAAEEVWLMIKQNKPVREKIPGSFEIPLSHSCKQVLVLAAEQADLLSSKLVGSEHLLLGLLREAKSHAEEILRGQGIRLMTVHEELKRLPHDDSAIEEFVREPRSLPKDVADLQIRIKSIVTNVENAIANRDYGKAQEYSNEEGKERDKLYLLYEHYGLSDWIFD